MRGSFSLKATSHFPNITEIMFKIKIEKNYAVGW
jgi:hypothetical protein